VSGSSAGRPVARFELAVCAHCRIPLGVRPFPVSRCACVAARTEESLRRTWSLGVVRLVAEDPAELAALVGPR
jgi:hypothetical protein